MSEMAASDPAASEAPAPESAEAPEFPESPLVAAGNEAEPAVVAEAAGESVSEAACAPIGARRIGPPDWAPAPAGQRRVGPAVDCRCGARTAAGRRGAGTAGD